MSAMSQPDYCRPPPTEYPFGKYVPSPEFKIQDREKIEEYAKGKLESEDYVHALWIYENLLELYSECSLDLTEQQSRVTFTCATTLLTIAQCEEPERKKICLEKAMEFCKRRHHLDDTIYSAKAYECEGDIHKLLHTLSSEKDAELLSSAYHCYRKSFEIKNCTSVLFKLITTYINFSHDVKVLMKYQYFLISGTLSEFQNFVNLIASHKNQITLHHRKFFFFKQKFCLIRPRLNNDVLSQLIEICWELNCMKSMQAVWECTDDAIKSTKILLLSDKNLKIVKVLLGQAFSTVHFRTSYLLDRIKANDIKASLVAIQSGSISDMEKNVQKVATLILKSDASYEPVMYLKQEDDTTISPTNDSPSKPLNCLVENLSFKCRQRAKFTKKVTKFLTFLIKTGADVECLNRQAGGNRTSPLIVATNLALVTENTEIFDVVMEKKSSSWVTTDVNGKTPLQLAQECPRESSAKHYLIKKLGGDDRAAYITSASCKYGDSEALMNNNTMSSPSASELETNKVDQLKSKTFAKRRRRKLLRPTSTIPGPLKTPISSISENALKHKVKAFLSSEKIKSITAEDTNVSLNRDRLTLTADNPNIPLENSDNIPENEPVMEEEILQANELGNFDESVWEIELHENVVKFKADSSHPYKIREQLVTKLKTIASGEWNEKNHKPIIDKHGIIIYEARLTKPMRILYQVVTRFSERQTEEVKFKSSSGKAIHVYTQAIIVWEIVVNHDHINRAAQRILKAIQNVKTTPTSLHPIDGKKIGDDGIVYPQLYVTPELDELTKTKVLERLKQSCNFQNQLQEYDVGTKMYSVTNDIILGFLDKEDTRRDYPIKTTDEEHDIIMLPSNEPVIVLGRSGTGKTTTCLIRLWLNYKNYWQEASKQKQSLILKTINPDEQIAAAAPTEEIFQNGESQPDADNHDRNMSVSDGSTPESSDEEEFECLHQIFITKNSALCRKMKDRFYDFVAGCDYTKSHLQHEDEVLPQTFSDIKNFPVFLTSRQFFAMLDKSIDDGKEYIKSGGYRVESQVNHADTHSLSLLFDLSDDESDEEEEQTEKIVVKREVTADEFCTSIWPNIAKHSSDPNIDPILIWTEIQSFIEGSTQALESEKGFLPEKEYETLGTKQASNFPFQRSEVYKLFTEYKKEIKHKNIRHQFDNGEYVWNLNKRLTAKGFQNLPWTFHELYIDETQDFTQAELAVILKCCKNPNRSFLAGDTAQTIIKGILFRFEDLKSLFHKGLNVPGVKCNTPSLHKLTTNHRSHSGITDLATSLTDLLKEYFPYSFDCRNIPEDRSNIKGPKPLFIGSQELLENFLLPLTTEDISSIEFGAAQVVIARDSSEEGKKKMPRYLQDVIVLNPQECKGLEFNDVLLYNFFTDTVEQNKEMWKIPMSFFSKHPEEISRKEFEKAVHAIEFNEIYHKSFCAELKTLYTIVTRAKRCVWIYEDSSLKELSMLNYWFCRDMVEGVTSQHSANKESAHDSETIIPQSTPLEEWKKQGDSYMEKKLWLAAEKCYQKAEEMPLGEIAHAHFLEEKALRAKKTDPSQFREAADKFIESSTHNPRIDLVYNAAACLYKANMHLESIQLFEEIREYKLALRICRKHMDSDLQMKVRLNDKLGRYKTAIKLLLARERYEEALTLAREKKVDHEKLTEVAYKQIKKVLKAGNCSHEVTKLVEFIPIFSQRVYFLKQAKQYTKACELLIVKKKYRDACRICRAQHVYADVIPMLQTGSDADQSKYLLMLLLAQAEHYLVTKETEQAKECLTNLLKLKLSEAQKARTNLLYAGAFLSEQEPNFSQAVKYCIEAHRLNTKVVKSKAGEIEAFNLLSKVVEPTVEHGRLIAATIALVEQMCTLLKKTAATFTVEINDIEQFYGLEKDGNKHYFVPQHSCSFLTFDGTQKDADGMLQLDERKVLEQVQEHYKQYAANWKLSIKNVQQSWETQVKRSFSFHAELLQPPFYLQGGPRKFPQSQIKDYLTMCDWALRFSQLSTDDIDPDAIIEQVYRLLSPFSQICLPFKQETYEHLASLSYIKDAINKKVSKQIESITFNFDTPPDLNKWLQLWNILHAIGREKVKDLLIALQKQSKRINYNANTYYGCDPTCDPPFSYISRNNHDYQSIQSLWDRSCELYRENKALIATKISFHSFIQIIARRRSLNKTFSLENLISVLTVQTTALLAMQSASLFKNKQYNVMVIPESFDSLINNFDLINSSSDTSGRLLTACFSTSEQVAPDKVLQTTKNILIEILNLLIGKYKISYFPLKEAVCNGTDTEAVHCLALALTVLGNLVLHKWIFAYSSLHFLQAIIKVLEIFTGYEEVCHALKNCIDTRNLFQVLHQQLNSIGLKLVSLQTVTILGKVNLRIKSPLFPLQIPKMPFSLKSQTENVQDVQLEVSSNSKSKVTNDQDQLTVQKFDSGSPEDEDDDIDAELNAIEKIEYKPEPEPVVDTELEEEKRKCLNNNQCTVCNESVKNDEHFRTEAHRTQKKGYNSCQYLSIAFNLTQDQLLKLILTCHEEEVGPGNYELERITLEAEDLIEKNKEQITQVNKGYNWNERYINLSKLMEKTEKFNRLIYEHLEKARKNEQQVVAPLSEEEKSEEDEELNIELTESKHVKKKQSKKRR